MKKYILFLIIFTFLFTLSITSAEDFGYNYLEGDLNVAQAVNYSQVNVNNSQFLRGYVPTDFVAVTGDTMTGDLTISNADIDLTDTTTNQILLPTAGTTPTAPTLAFGDGDSGIYERTANSLAFTTNGVLNMIVDSLGKYVGGVSNSFAFLGREGATSTNPTIAPSKADLNTGIGWAGASQMSLIAGSTEFMRVGSDRIRFYGKAYFDNQLNWITGYGQNGDLTVINDELWSATNSHTIIQVFRRKGAGAGKAPNNADIYQIQLTGSDGNGNRDVARIGGRIIGTVSAGDISGELYWSTRNGTGSLTERMILDSNGMLSVYGNTSGISIYAEGNVSASGYNTHTSIYDKDAGSPFDYIKDSNYYLDKNGDIDHSKFYGDSGTILIQDTSRPVIKMEEKQNCTDNVIIKPYCYSDSDNSTICEDVPVTEEVCEVYIEPVITYPYMKEQGQVSLSSEVDLLRQAVFIFNDCLEKSLTFDDYKFCVANN